MMPSEYRSRAVEGMAVSANLARRVDAEREGMVGGWGISADSGGRDSRRCAAGIVFGRASGCVAFRRRVGAGRAWAGLVSQGGIRGLRYRGGRVGWWMGGVGVTAFFDQTACRSEVLNFNPWANSFSFNGCSVYSDVRDGMHGSVPSSGASSSCLNLRTEECKVENSCLLPPPWFSAWR